jgi:hypothetical protein
VIDLGTPKPGRSATRKTLPKSERSSALNNVGIHWSVLPKSWRFLHPDRPWHRQKNAQIPQNNLSVA